MKQILFSIILLTSFNAFSFVEVDVLSTEVGVEDYSQRKALCLTIVRIPKNGSVLGVLETIEDCFIGRMAKKSQRIKLDLNKLQKITDYEMKDYLQSLDSHIEFYFSEAE